MRTKQELAREAYEVAQELLRRVIATEATIAAELEAARAAYFAEPTAMNHAVCYGQTFRHDAAVDSVKNARERVEHYRLAYEAEGEAT
jgi:Xaa-Pro aminopeptidase